MSDKNSGKTIRDFDFLNLYFSHVVNGYFSFFFREDELIPRVLGSCEFRAPIRCSRARSQLWDSQAFPPSSPCSCGVFQHERWNVLVLERSLPLVPFPSLSPLITECVNCVYLSFKAPLKLFPKLNSIPLETCVTRSLSHWRAGPEGESAVTASGGPRWGLRGASGALMQSAGCADQ